MAELKIYKNGQWESVGDIGGGSKVIQDSGTSIKMPEASIAEGVEHAIAFGKSRVEGNYAFASGINTEAHGDCSSAFGGSAKDVYIKNIKFIGDANALTYKYVEDTYDSLVVEYAKEQQSPILTLNKNEDGTYKTVTITNVDSENKTVTFSGSLNEVESVEGVPYLIYYLGINESHNEAKGIASHVEGNGSVSEGIGAHVEGFGGYGYGGYTHTEGISCKTYGYASHTEGNMTETGPMAPYSHAEGGLTYVGGANAHVEGMRSKAMSSASHAEGYSTTAEGYYSHSEGRETQSLGHNSHAEGEGTKSIGRNSHTGGYKTISEGENSYAGGEESSSQGKNSFAHGYFCSSTGSHGAHAEGQKTLSQGQASHAEGRETKALGNYSHASNLLTEAQGISSHAEGYKSLAKGAGSHAEGGWFISNGNKAIGGIAEGNGSHAEGNNTTASGLSSHAEGTSTVAAGNSSHTSGIGTVANHEAETAVGKYNISRENYELYGGADGSHTIFSVGVGNEGSAANALEISNKGDVFVNKQLYIGDPANIDNSGDMMAEHRVITGAEFDSVKEKVYDFFDNPDLKDETIDTLKEIQDYIDSDAGAAQEMLNRINETKELAASAHNNINTKIATVKIDLDKRVERDNLKTINGNSIVGTGDLEIVPYAQVSLSDIQNSNFKVIPGQWYEITGYYEEDPTFTFIGLAIGNDKFAPKGFAKRLVGGNVEVYEVMFDATIKSGNIEGVEEWTYNIQSSTIDDSLENFTVEPITSKHLVVIPKYDTDDSGIINGENTPTDYIFDTTTPIYESPVLAIQSYPLTMSLAQAEVLKQIFSGGTPYAPSYTVNVDTIVEDGVEVKVIASVAKDGEVVEENNFFSVDGLFEERISSYWDEDEDRVHLEITLKYDNNESSFTLTSDVYDAIVEISDSDDQYLGCLKNVLAPKLLYADAVSDYNVYFMLSGIKVKENKVWTNLVALHPVTSEEDTIVFTPLYLEDSSGKYEQCDVILENEECDHWSNYGHIPITFDLESNYTNNIKETVGTFNAKILHMKDSRGNGTPYDFIHTMIDGRYTFSGENNEENSVNCKNNTIGGIGVIPKIFFVGNVNNNTVLPGASNIIIKSSGNFIGPGDHSASAEITNDFTTLLNGMVSVEQ